MHASPDPLITEYFHLWKDHGIDDLNPFVSLIDLKREPKSGGVLFIGRKEEFTGAAGTLFDKVTSAMGLNKNAVQTLYWTNPETLKTELSTQNPRVIVTLGLDIAQSLAGNTQAISGLKGRLLKLQWDDKVDLLGIHPMTYLNENPTAKKEAWDDLKLVIELLKKE